MVFNLRPRTIDSDLRWKQEPAEKISGLHELKRSVWRILALLFIDLLEWKPHRLRLAQLQDPFEIKPFVTNNRTLYCLVNVKVALITSFVWKHIMGFKFFFLPSRRRKLLPGYRVFAAMSFLVALQRPVHAFSVHSVACRQLSSFWMFRQQSSMRF